MNPSCFSPLGERRQQHQTSAKKPLILFQLQPDIQLQGNESLGHSDKKKPQQPGCGLATSHLECC